MPAFKNCAVCNKPSKDHANNEHEPVTVTWHGWHGFRRGLATVLHDKHVSDLTIQAILRHSDVFVTRAAYIKRTPQTSIDAMKLLKNDSQLRVVPVQ
jgi:integrase